MADDVGAKMTKTKQQHYVPQFYLRNFADAGGRLFAYDKSADKSFATNVRDVAGQRYFYDVSELDHVTGLSQTIEKHFQMIEGDAAPFFAGLLDALAAGSFTSISPEQRSHISFYLANQIVRTKEFRKQTVEIHLKAYHEILMRSVAVEPPEWKDVPFNVKLREGGEAAIHAETILDKDFVLKLADILHNHIWIVGINRTPMSFYTSDHPIARHAHVEHPFFGMSGYASRGIEVAYPLSPRFLLSMCERTFFADFADKDGQTLDLAADDNITYYNAEQVFSSDRFLYCERDDFAFAKRVCDKEPDFRNPTRDRVTMG